MQMTEQEARNLTAGKKIILLDNSTSVYAEGKWTESAPRKDGKVFTVERVEQVVLDHTRIWLKETGRFVLPGQASRL